MPHCVLWTVSLKQECSDELELQNVHLNEITQFDFAEVIRQVNPTSRYIVLTASRSLQRDNYFKIQLCAI